MKSSLKIALGVGNEPVIQFQIIPSDDLRDQVCRQFLDKLGGTSNYCYVSINGWDYQGDGRMLAAHNLEISPIQGYPSGCANPLENINQIFGINYAFLFQTKKANVEVCYDAHIIYWVNKKDGTMSPEYSRRQFEQLALPELAQRVTTILKNMESWEPISEKPLSGRINIPVSC